MRAAIPTSPAQAIAPTPWRASHDTGVSAVRAAALLLATLVAAAGLALPGGVAGAQEDPGAEEPDTTPPAGQAAAVDRRGYWTGDGSAIFPAIATSEFPPGVACILVPEACSDDANQITDPIQEALGSGTAGVDSAGPAPAQPVVPGTLPVGMLTGEERYTSGLHFTLPTLESGNQVEQFTLVLRQNDMSYATDSPAFREVVGATIAQVQAGEPTPEAFQGALERASSGESPLLDQLPTGIEACAITATWPEGENQPVAERPVFDCLFGTTGVFDEPSASWVFDLGFAAEAWYEGTIPNEGILLRPLAADNLAFGDPNYTTNFVLMLEGGEDPATAPAVAFEQAPAPVRPPPAPPAPPPPPPPPPPAPASSGGSRPSSSTGSSGSRPASSGTTTSNVPSAPLPAAPSVPVPSGLPVVLPDTVADEAAATTAAPEVAAAPPLAEVPEFTPASDERPLPSLWWVWLLLPASLSGAWWYGRVLDVDPAATRARAGALTRLLQRRGFSA